MVRRAVETVVAALALAQGCTPKPVPQVRLFGYVIPPISGASRSLAGSPVDVVALRRDLGKGAAATAVEVAGSGGVYYYEVRLDATVLPAAPLPFKVAVRNPEPAPRDGPLLAGIVRLFRPPGDIEDLGSFRLDLDATSSLAALGIEYRSNLAPDATFAEVDPIKAAKRFDKALMTFNFQQAYGSFLAGRTNEAPAASLDLAQQASEELPPDLSAL
ncbi:MAG: hypothetical protein FJZ01_24630 [Candidatus Sericytochromatia bacterium]|nr:hypothetical protein [Candidatus Tanganyikabacteria bacterium]